MHCTSQSASISTTDMLLSSNCLYLFTFRECNAWCYKYYASSICGNSKHSKSPFIQLADLLDDYMCISIQCTTSVSEMDTNQTLPVHQRGVDPSNIYKAIAKNCVRKIVCLCNVFIKIGVLVFAKMHTSKLDLLVFAGHTVTYISPIGRCFTQQWCQHLLVHCPLQG